MIPASQLENLCIESKRKFNGAQERQEKMKKRILFLCAQRSVRSQMAESILTFRGHAQWDIWSTPIHESQERTFALKILEEIGIPLVETPQTTEPYFGLRWDEGVILCSGMADT
jgi:hypothetical protein